MTAKTAAGYAACTLSVSSLLLSGGPSLGATVIATEQYQAELPAACASFCRVEFPAPAAKHRLNLTRVSCWITGNVAINLATLQLISAENSRLLSQFLPIVAPAVSGNQLLNQTVDMQVGPKQHARIEFERTAGDFAGADCTVTGTVDTLQ
jgi:hypothetical protein